MTAHQMEGSMSRFFATVSDRRPVAVTVELAGPVTTARRPDLDAVLARLGTFTSLPVVVVDLSRVETIDPTGVEFVAYLVEDMRRRGTTVRVTGATRRVRQRLDLAGLGAAVVDLPRPAAKVSSPEPPAATRALVRLPA
jgi:anti-anti-sigma factor